MKPVSLAAQELWFLPRVILEFCLGTQVFSLPSKIGGAGDILTDKAPDVSQSRQMGLWTTNPSVNSAELGASLR